MSECIDCRPSIVEMASNRSYGVRGADIYYC